MTGTMTVDLPGAVSVTEDRGGLVATILIDRSAKLNALTLEMLAALEDRLSSIAESTAQTVVLRTGARRFSASALTSRRSRGYRR